VENGELAAEGRKRREKVKGRREKVGRGPQTPLILSSERSEQSKDALGGGVIPGEAHARISASNALRPGIQGHDLL
jgi:hypothetical protein